MSRLERVVLVWIALLATVWVGYDTLRTQWLTADEPRPISPRATLSEMEETATEIFQRISPSVAYIVTQTAGGLFLPPSTEALGAGSGFIWDAAGHIVTNHHVIAGADQVGVRLGGEELLRAEVVGSTADYDLAVLRLVDNHQSLQPIPIGSSADLRVGQTTFAIGSPYGLSRTLTTGVISALDRRLPAGVNREIRGVIQTDAAINPGNSGGPLLDSAGRLIGVNTAILSQSGAFAGIGFAVPVDIVNRIVPQIIRDGYVPRPGIGITTLPEELAAQVDVQGVVVAGVSSGSPAQEAGLQGIDQATGQLGDVITHINGKRVLTVPDLVAELTDIGVGNEARLTVRRDGESREVTLTVMDISA
ncbi:trypsin-like peptidase domain-containing protein [Rhodospirillaceae bacterium SYSU D60014]|uniref:S1C family serine protease n=1 Tax=Virgifigura deserti TaxID=2268457 RepID=UPI000E676151